MKIIHEAHPDRYVIEVKICNEWRPWVSRHSADEAIWYADKLARDNPGENYRVVDMGGAE